MFLIANICAAQEFAKNGLPCVSEICLGDGIAELSKVQWDRAKNPFSSQQMPLYTAVRKVNASETQIVKLKFRGDTEQAAPFLLDQQFDALALPSLAHITAACEQNELIGTYTTQSGNPTRVGISLIPRQSDTSVQHWTVTSIVRTFPKAVSAEQKAEVEAELTNRYYAFGANNPGIKNAKPGEGRFFSNYGSTFGFHLSLFTGIDKANRLKLHPSCGGTTKIKID